MPSGSFFFFVLVLEYHECRHCCTVQNHCKLLLQSASGLRNHHSYFSHLWRVLSSFEPLFPSFTHAVPSLPRLCLIYSSWKHFYLLSKNQLCLPKNLSALIRQPHSYFIVPILFMI
uniref:Secreted protein n=1 Tax=Rhipicephalus zambeziensis TaxID=60191 RepID=A0A224YCU4_9ACAR